MTFRHGRRGIAFLAVALVGLAAVVTASIVTGIAIAQDNATPQGVLPLRLVPTHAGAGMDTSGLIGNYCQQGRWVNALGTPTPEADATHAQIVCREQTTANPPSDGVEQVFQLARTGGAGGSPLHWPLSQEIVTAVTDTNVSDSHTDANALTIMSKRGNVTANQSYNLADATARTTSEKNVAKLEGQQTQIEGLQNVTVDLHYTPTTWARVVGSGDQGGLAISPDASGSESAARRVTTWSSPILNMGTEQNPGNLAGHEILVRIPASESTSRYRWFTSSGGTTDDTGTGPFLLNRNARSYGKSADERWEYYGTELEDMYGQYWLERSTQSGHSEFRGNPTQVKRWALTDGEHPIPIADLGLEQTRIDLFQVRFDGFGVVRDGATDEIIAANTTYTARWYVDDSGGTDETREFWPQSDAADWLESYTDSILYDKQPRNQLASSRYTWTMTIRADAPGLVTDVVFAFLDTKGPKAGIEIAQEVRVPTVEGAYPFLVNSKWLGSSTYAQVWGTIDVDENTDGSIDISIGPGAFTDYSEALVPHSIGNVDIYLLALTD